MRSLQTRGGGFTWLLMAGMAGCLAGQVHAAEAPGGRVHLEIHPTLQAAAERGTRRVGRVRLRPTGDAEAGFESPLSLVAPTALELPHDGEWEICGWVEGFWSPCRRTIFAAGGGAPLAVSLPFWPAARVEGRLEAAAGRPGSGETRLPERVRVVFSPAAGTGVRGPRGESASKDGTWSCSLPTGRLDLVVRPIGFVPAYRWDVDLERGLPKDLGVIELATGSSFVGSVEVEDGVVDPETCRATLIPAVALGSNPRVASRIDKTRHSASVGERGFFQLRGIAPGSYYLEVTQRGMAASRVFGLEIRDDSETVLERPVVLRPPVTATVQVEPAEDELGEPWSVLLAESSGIGGRVRVPRPLQMQTDESGRATFRDVPPGRYLLQVLDGQRQSFYTEPDVRIESDPFFFDARLELVAVTGHLTLASDPIPGTLWFGGRHGSARAKVVADEDGMFYGVLPRSGSWRIQVEVAEPPITERIDARVEPDSTGLAELDLALPDTRAFGVVVDGDGQPVTGAGVFLNGDRFGAEAHTGKRGRFELRGFPPGRITLTARGTTAAGRAESDLWLGDVRDGAASGPITLELRRTTTLSGSVVTETGTPVPGASISSWTIRPRRSPSGSSTNADVEGRFTIRVREGSEDLAVFVAAPGLAFTAATVPARSPLTLVARRDSGDLEVEAKAVEAGDNLGLIVWKDDLLIPTNLLFRWARMRGVSLRESDSTVVFPSLAVGNYRVCLARRGQLVSEIEARDGAGAPGCDEGFVGSGATLHLRIKPPTQEGKTR